MGHQSSDCRWAFQSSLGIRRGIHPELSGGITTLTVVIQVANFCAAMDTLIDQDARYPT